MVQLNIHRNNERNSIKLSQVVAIGVGKNTPFGYVAERDENEEKIMNIMEGLGISANPRSDAGSKVGTEIHEVTVYYCAVSTSEQLHRHVKYNLTDDKLYHAARIHVASAILLQAGFRKL